jgi:hypothetical protein
MEKSKKNQKKINFNLNYCFEGVLYWY